MAIWDLFKGYDKAHGRFDAKKAANESGKVQGNAITVRGPVTEELWNTHLAGSGAGLGIIPLLGDDTVVWGCIDIDKTTIDHIDLEKKILALEFPLVVARSKSGGAHCYLFTKEPVPAADARTAMESWAAQLGHGGCEVFPKQTSRYNENDLGNWLNMPYYQAEKTVRYGFKHGKKLTLDEFVKYAEAHKATPEQLLLPKALGAEDVGGMFAEGPCCLQYLNGSGGFPSGTRNDGMYNVAVYLRKAFPDNWQDKMHEYNSSMCSPPLTLAEITTIIKSVTKKDYGYRCKQPPIAAHCNRRVCLTRAYGVGDTTEGQESWIGAVTKVNGDPVLWFMDIGPRRMMFTSDELLSQSLFAKKCLDAVGQAPPVVPAQRWRKYMNEKLRGCAEETAPDDASPTGQFRLLVEQYVTGQAQATSKEELVHRATPFRTGTGVIWFRSNGLMAYLATHYFRYKSEHHVWQMLSDMGCTNEKVNIKGTVTNIWSIPEPKQLEEEAPLPDFGTKEF